MRTITDAERVRRALNSGDVAELEWARDHVQTRADAAPADDVKKYWLEILRRIDSKVNAPSTS